MFVSKEKQKKFKSQGEVRKQRRWKQGSSVMLFKDACLWSMVPSWTKHVQILLQILAQTWKGVWINFSNINCFNTLIYKQQLLFQHKVLQKHQLFQKHQLLQHSCIQTPLASTLDSKHGEPKQDGSSQRAHCCLALQLEARRATRVSSAGLFWQGTFCFCSICFKM